MTNRPPQDSVEVTALDDTDVPGVTLYISDFKRR
jgi:catabolite regulation protein CreA